MEQPADLEQSATVGVNPWSTDQLSCASLQISPDSSSTCTTPKLAWTHKVVSLQRIFPAVFRPELWLWVWLGRSKEGKHRILSISLHSVCLDRALKHRDGCFSIPVNWHSAQADKNSKSPWPSDSKNQSVCSNASSLPSYYDNCILSQPLPPIISSSCLSLDAKTPPVKHDIALLPLLQYIIICFRHLYTEIGIVLQDFRNSKVCARHINWPNYPNKNVTECKHSGVTNIHGRLYKEILSFSWLQRLLATQCFSKTKSIRDINTKMGL